MMDRIAVLDFGAQYTQLIARRIRELGVYSEILPCTQPVEDVLAAGYKGIVLSGGPASVYEDEAPLPDKRLFEAGIPLLGICYGMQAMGYLLGGHVVPAERREYGPAELRLLSTEGLLEGIVPERDGRIAVWMSHGDTVMQPPRGFVNLGTTENCPVAAMADDTRRLFAVQFHPEVAHTPQGKTILRNFLRLCDARADWSMPSFVDVAVESIRRQVGRDRVLCALSGGVDSSVVAVLIHRAIGDQLTCLFVDNGLLRKGEAESVVATFRDSGKPHGLPHDRNAFTEVRHSRHSRMQRRQRNRREAPRAPRLQLAPQRARELLEDDVSERELRTATVRVLRADDDRSGAFYAPAKPAGATELPDGVVPAAGAVGVSPEPVTEAKLNALFVFSRDQFNWMSSLPPKTDL
jgi:GMP synthase (glutamine-hydrolysing) A subunit